MAIKYHEDIVQGSDEWFQLRCGILTASEMKNVINKNFEAVKPTKREIEEGKEITHLYEMLAQRITRHVEPSYVNDDMLRGSEDEDWALIEYNNHYAPVQRMGFITNDKWGFTLGFSPDGLVGDDGFVECKSRKQKYQVKTILEYGTVPEEYIIQIHTGMMVSERKWCDFISYSNGMLMPVMRVHEDKEAQKAIAEVAADFEGRLQKKLEEYNAVVASDARLTPTERRTELEITI